MAVIPPKPNATTAPRSVSTAELMSQTGREFIMIAGKDGVGKTCALLSVAKWVQDALNPSARFYVIDTENKLPTALRTFGADAPTNLVYFKCEDMNAVTDATEFIMTDRRAGDWFATESMGRVWEKAQDMGYQAISGFLKIQYLEKRRAQKAAGLAQAPPIPKADEFWNIVKGAHDSAFVEPISQAGSLNILWTTTLNKPPKANAFMKENETRKEIRAEFGIDAGLEGAPRIPYYVETLCLMDMANGKVNCRVLRDNNSMNEITRPTFEVPDRKAWATQFWLNCR